MIDSINLSTVTTENWEKHKMRRHYYCEKDTYLLSCLKKNYDTLFNKCSFLFHLLGNYMYFNKF